MKLQSNRNPEKYISALIVQGLILNWEQISHNESPALLENTDLSLQGQKALVFSDAFKHRQSFKSPLFTTAITHQLWLTGWTTVDISWFS